MIPLPQFLPLIFIGICSAGFLFAQETRKDDPDLSLDSLPNVKTSTAAKYEQTISEAPASVTIITSEDEDEEALSASLKVSVVVYGSLNHYARLEGGFSL